LFVSISYDHVSRKKGKKKGRERKKKLPLSSVTSSGCAPREGEGGGVSKGGRGGGETSSTLLGEIIARAKNSQRNKGPSLPSFSCMCRGEEVKKKGGGTLRLLEIEEAIYSSEIALIVPTKSKKRDCGARHLVSISEPAHRGGGGIRGIMR